MPPGLSEDLALVVQLQLQVITQILQSILEFLLEVIEDVVHVPHRLLRLLLVFLDLTEGRHKQLCWSVLSSQRIKMPATYVYVFVNLCSSCRLDSILAFFISSKS